MKKGRNINDEREEQKWKKGGTEMKKGRIRNEEREDQK